MEVTASTWVSLGFVLFALLTVVPQVRILFAIVSGVGRTYGSVNVITTTFQNACQVPVAYLLTLLYLFLLVRVIPWPTGAVEFALFVEYVLGVIGVILSFYLFVKLMNVVAFVLQFLIKIYLHDPLLCSFTNDILLYSRLFLLVLVGFFVLIGLLNLLGLKQEADVLIQLFFYYNAFSLALSVLLVIPARNLVGTISVLVDSYVHYDDWIEINNLSGKVKSIGALKVAVEQSDNSIVSVPGGDFLSHPLFNHSQREDRKVECRLPLSELPVALTEGVSNGIYETSGIHRAFLARLEVIATQLKLKDWHAYLENDAMCLRWSVRGHSLTQYAKEKTEVLLQLTHSLQASSNA